MIKSIVDYIPSNQHSFQNTLDDLNSHFLPEKRSLTDEQRRYMRTSKIEIPDWTYRLDSRVRKFVKDDSQKAREVKKNQVKNKSSSASRSSAKSGGADLDLVRFFCDYRTDLSFSLLKLIRNLATHGSTLESDQYSMRI